MALTAYENSVLAEMEAHLAPVTSTPAPRRASARWARTVLAVTGLLVLAAAALAAAGVGVIAVLAAGWSAAGFGIPAFAVLVVMWLSFAGVPGLSGASRSRPSRGSGRRGTAGR